MLFDDDYCVNHPHICDNHAIPETLLTSLDIPVHHQQFLSIGVPDSGLDFRDQGDTLFALYHGEIFWKLFPPFFDPRAHHVQDISKECLLRPGELLFIPEGWSHAMANFGDTVGLSIESRIIRSEMLRLKYYYLDPTKTLSKVDAMTKGAHQYGDIAYFRWKLGEALYETKSQRVSYISNLYHRALSSDPGHCAGNNLNSLITVITLIAFITLIILRVLISLITVIRHPSGCSFLSNTRQKYGYLTP
jgi:hypothetical protein